MALLPPSGDGNVSASVGNLIYGPVIAKLEAIKKDPSKFKREEIDSAIYELKSVLFSKKGMEAWTPKIGRQIGALIRLINSQAFKELQAVVAGALKDQILFLAGSIDGLKTIAENSKSIDAVKIDSAIYKLKSILYSKEGMEAWTPEIGKEIGTLVQRINSELFKELQDVVSGVLKDKILRAPKVFNDFERELEALVQSIKNDSTDENLKKAGRWLTNHFKWFRRVNSDGIPLNFEQQRTIQTLLDELELALFRQTADTAVPTNVSNLRRLIQRLRPERLPLLDVFPTKGYEAADSIGAVRLMMLMSPRQGYQIMANWIETNKIPLADIDLTHEELLGIAPVLKHVDLENYPFPVPTDEGMQQFIRSFTNVYHLLIDNNKNISTIPSMLSLTALTCSDSSISTLPEGLKSLKTIICAGCMNLEVLPNDLQNLEILDCTESGLKALPSLSRLKFLCCGSCSKLESLPEDLGCLEELYCFSCNFRALPEDLSMLKILNCSHCIDLTALSKNLKNLMKLNCSFCDALSVLPEDLEKLEELYCAKCRALTTLPEKLNSLKILNCRSSSFTNLPSGLMHLKQLICGDSSRLEKLPDDMSSLMELDCSCTSLTLPNGLKSLEKLNCRGCPNIKDLPRDLEHLKSVIYGPKWLRLPYGVYSEHWD